MKHIKSIGGVVAVLAGTMLGAWGQDFRTDINPALIYYQAILTSPEPLTNTDLDYLSSSAGLSQPLPERFDAVFAGTSNQFQLVRHAAHSTVPCDWGIDWSAGSETLLPQLGRLKAVSNKATFRARWQLQHNQPNEAADDLVAAFVMARNSSRDGSLIAVLVQDAVENIVFMSVAQNFGHFTPEALGQLAVGMQTAPPRGTMESAMRVETYLHSVWLPNWIRGLQRQYNGDDAKVLAAVKEVFTGGDGGSWKQSDWQRFVAAAGGTSDGLLKMVQEMQPLATQMADLMAMPQPQFEAATNEFNAAVQNSTNPLARLLLPSVSKARPREFGTLENEAMVQAAIAYKLNGATGLNSVMDPSGTGPFQLQRFMFNGVDRGFELKGADTGRGFPSIMIFVETDGPAFNVYGTKVGQPVTP
jgi:hypothetical protein